MPVMDHLVPKVGVFVLQADDFAPNPKDGVQQRPESFYLSDFVQNMRAKRPQSLHFLGDDVHITESLHSMTTVRVRTGSSA